MSNDVIFEESQYLGYNKLSFIRRMVLALFCFLSYYWSENTEEAIGSGNLLLFSIFLYKKKNLQIKIIRVFSILYFIFGCCIVFFIDVEHSSFIVFGIFSACIFSYLATKYIKKDIELISSSNRIR